MEVEKVNVADKILEEARGLFLQFGLKTVSMDDIARSVGVSKKTIYQHYKDKNAIIAKVVKTHFDRQKELIIETTTDTENCIEELYEMSKCMRMSVESVNPAVMYDLERFYPKMFKIFIKFKYEFILEHLKNTLVRGMKEGYFREDINVDIIATLRMAQVQFSFDPEIYPKEKFNFQEVHQQLFKHFALGLLTDNGRVLFKHYFDEEHEA